MSQLNAEVYATRIGTILGYLKKNKISQYEIEERLNYTSLSKAKNYQKYPQIVIEKLTRKELYEKLLQTYGLRFNENTQKVEPAGQEIATDNSTADDQYFIMHYFAFARDTIARAIVRVVSNKHAIIDYRFDEHWEGSYEVIENYTFLCMEKKGEVTPVKKLICLFTGTKKSGRPYLFGTYSTVKRDGIPAAGKIFFERVEKEQIEKKIKKEVDPRITSYLLNTVWVTETFTPNTLDNLSNTYRLISRFSSRYYLFYSKANGELVRADLTCEKTSRCNLLIKDLTYYGSYKPVDNHTIKIELNANTGFSEIFVDSIILFSNMSKSKYDPFYLCHGISNALETRNNAFSCMLIERKEYDNRNNTETDKILDNIKGMNSVVSL